MQTHPVLLCWINRQFKWFHAKEQRMKSAVRGQLYYSSPNPPHRYYSCFINLQSIRAAMKAKHWSLRTRKKKKKKPDTGQTILSILYIQKRCSQGTLGGFFPLPSSQLAHGQDIKFSLLFPVWAELQFCCMLTNHWVIRDIPKSRQSNLASIPDWGGWG